MLVIDHIDRAGMEEEREAGNNREDFTDRNEGVRCVLKMEKISERGSCLHSNPVELVEHGSARRILCLFCERLRQTRHATNKAVGDKNVSVCTAAGPCFIHT